MTKHVNEFNPNSQNPTAGVQVDAQKLKFNNIRSCIAVGVVPHTGNQLIGVHFTVVSMKNEQEADGAIATIKSKLAGSACDVYLVAAWKYYATTSLLKKLKKIATRIYLSDVSENSAGEADVDVKMEITSGSLVISLRQHALIIAGSDGKRVLKDKYATPGSIPRNIGQTGKTTFQTDRDSKPWMRIQPTLIHPG